MVKKFIHTKEGNAHDEHQVFCAESLTLGFGGSDLGLGIKLLVEEALRKKGIRPIQINSPITGKIDIDDQTR
jgi:hypothetical protein